MTVWSSHQTDYQSELKHWKAPAVRAAGAFCMPRLGLARWPDCMLRRVVCEDNGRCGGLSARSCLCWARLGTCGL